MLGSGGLIFGGSYSAAAAVTVMMMVGLCRIYIVNMTRANL
jgi:hypothetical protein